MLLGREDSIHGSRGERRSIEHEASKMARELRMELKEKTLEERQRNGGQGSSPQRVVVHAATDRKNDIAVYTNSIASSPTLELREGPPPPPPPKDHIRTPPSFDRTFYHAV